MNNKVHRSLCLIGRGKDIPNASNPGVTPFIVLAILMETSEWSFAPFTQSCQGVHHLSGGVSFGQLISKFISMILYEEPTISDEMLFVIYLNLFG